MSSVEGETGPYSETCVTCDVDATEEVSIKVEDARDIKEEASVKVEEAIHIKDEIPEATTFSSIKTEHEVGFTVYVRWWHLMLLGHLMPQKGNCEVIFNYLLLCVILCPFTFRNLDCNSEGK
jgi:hypothetical protein